MLLISSDFIGGATPSPFDDPSDDRLGVVHPSSESSQTLDHGSRWAPPEIVQRLPDITHKDPLITGSPVFDAVLDLLPREGLQMPHELEQRTRVGGAAPDIVDFAVALLDMRDGAQVALDQVLDK